MKSSQKNKIRKGSGVKCFSRGTFVMKANPNYYRGKPAVDRIVIKKVPQSSNRTLALRGGNAGLTQRLTTREFNGLRTGRTHAGLLEHGLQQHRLPESGIALDNDEPARPGCDAIERVRDSRRFLAALEQSGHGHWAIPTRRRRVWQWTAQRNPGRGA